MIRTLDDLAEASSRRVESIPTDLRDDLRAQILIAPVDGSEVANRLRARWPALPGSFLDVLRHWDVLERSFTGFIVRLTTTTEVPPGFRWWD